MLAHQHGFISNIEADHSERPAGLKNNLRGLGIVVNVGFGGSVYVSSADGAAHEDDFFDQWNDGGVFLNGQCDVGERADGQESDLMRGGVNHFYDQVGAPAGVGFAFAGRKLNVGQAVFTVPELGGDELLKEGVLRASGDQHVATVGKRDHAKRVFQTLRSGDVAGNYGEGKNVQFRGIEGQHDCQGVVGTGGSVH